MKFKDIFLAVPRAAGRGMRKLNSRIKMKMTVKMSVLYGILFLILQAGVILLVRAIAANNLSRMSIEGRISEADAHEFLVALTAASIAAGAFALALLCALGILFSGAVTRPIGRIADTVKQVNRDNLDVRVVVSESQDEVCALAVEINKMLDNLEAAFGAQDRFASDASHELRTPIAVIDGYAQMLKRWGSKDEKIIEEGIDAITKEAERMRRLIDNMLFLARTERNVQALKPETFFLDDLLDEVVKDEKMVAGNTFVRAFMQPTHLTADRELIRQLLRIILDNAVKYSPAESEIKLSCFTDDDDRPTVIVEDKGEGIAEEDLVHLFERFFRADKVRTHGENGSGLGLAIAKKIADKHSAEIQIESMPGDGTTVKIIFGTQAGGE